MIKSFRSKETKLVFARGVSRKLPYEIHRVALRKLLMLDAALSLEDLKIPPSNHLKLLKGNKECFYSIRINKKWRVCFKWFYSNAYEVEIIDYH